MKALRPYLPAGALLIALAAVFFLAVGGGSKRPRFVAGAPPSIAPVTMEYYSFLADSPFEGDRLWILTGVGTSARCYLYDLTNRTILGELTGGTPVGTPVLYDSLDSRVLVMVSSEVILTTREKVESFIRKISGGPPVAGSCQLETYWMLDLRNNTASRMGEVQHWERTSSTWQSSPGGRYGVMQPTTSTGSSFVLCDLAKGEFTEIREPGGPCGWWTDHEILMKDASMNQFDLYDVGTRRRRPLFSPADVQAVLVKEGLAGSITNLYAFPNWNGQSYDFYFYPPESWGGLRNPDTSLFKADQADPALKLLYRSFRVRWGAHLDATGAHYLYPGESGKPGSSPDGAVYLENLTDGTTVTVVSPDNKGGYSSPAFYGGEVVYFRNRLLRRVQINGSNDTPLLPINVK